MSDSSTEATTSVDARRRGVWLTLLLTLLILLALLFWCLLWPVPEERRGQGAEALRRAGAGAGALDLQVTDVRLTDAKVGSKGVGVLVSFRIGRGRYRRPLDPSFVTLELGTTRLPAIKGDAAMHAGADPFLDEVGEDALLGSLAFAVPIGATMATLTVQPPDLGPAGAARAGVLIPQGGAAE